jgi:hypothetical protein
MERVIARPGTYLCLSQTLFGPKNYGKFPVIILALKPGMPCINLDGSILPFYLLTLAASSISSGLWSLLKGVLVHADVLSSLHNMALESPEFAHKSILSYINTTTAVEPLNILSIFELFSNFS